jgi:hypothetical protein
LKYTAQDLRVLAECSVLLDSMATHDKTAKDDAKQAVTLVKSLWAHVNRKRQPGSKPTPQPPKPAA